MHPHSALRQLLDAATSDEPVQLDVWTARRMVRRYVWLLRRLEPAGVTLTLVGRLPPVHIRAGINEIGLADEQRRNSHEDSAALIHELRVSAAATGLAERVGRKLVATPRGRWLCSRPIGLWWHLARSLPAESAHPLSYEAGLALLGLVASGSKRGLAARLAELLDALGWVKDDGAAPTTWDAVDAALETHRVLRLMGCLQPISEGAVEVARPTADGERFARAALRMLCNVG
ncbi:hypothetical protein EF847_21865 [Actinobacteria bacterium YIM 96077]|uniref:Uncharacterized protein n=1 Tax=Phytoactinopolyspora halophila TaxID=1981511 RepID=A0A329QSZ6_9ACTN|nr:hypothetical protein EF847_21865 [Actinobacteria bacterium YIM 96077]RAW15397.1 hypothetical protein DPM12_09095 [Phytoactinopolyspora halophila]